MDAEDIVQDAYVRWQEASVADVRSPRAYLATIVTRLAINHLRSARVTREAYVGPWLPEPLVTDQASLPSPPDPSTTVELAESLSMAFLVLLERLAPVERAVFLLHEVFDFEFAEIAPIVDKTAANCRQLFARAKKRVGAPRARFEADPEQARRLVERFTTAARAGDLGGLLAILADDITVWADGGGKAKGAARKPVRGAINVAKFAIGVAQKGAANAVLHLTAINGQPGFIAYAAGQPLAALAFDIRGDRIHAIYVMANPDKLQTLPASSSGA